MRAHDSYITNLLKLNDAIFSIPVYQRNYAWGKDEIAALIQDIYDARELVDSSKMLNIFGRENVRSDLIDAQKYIEKIRQNLML